VPARALPKVHLHPKAALLKKELLLKVVPPRKVLLLKAEDNLTAFNLIQVPIHRDFFYVLAFLIAPFLSARTL
jgi:hypothetical protein